MAHRIRCGLVIPVVDKGIIVNLSRFIPEISSQIIRTHFGNSLRRMNVLLAAGGSFLIVACTTMSPGSMAQNDAAMATSIVGNWVVTEAVREMEPNPDLVEASVVFNADNSFSIRRKQRTPWAGVYELNADTGSIDFIFTGRGFVPPKEGDVWLAIYRFNSDGSLEINTTEGHEARPEEFLSGDDLTLMNLRRAN